MEMEETLLRADKIMDLIANTLQKISHGHIAQRALAWRPKEEK